MFGKAVVSAKIEAFAAVPKHRFAVFHRERLGLRKSRPFSAPAGRV
jgi:hypothetical protein